MIKLFSLKDQSKPQETAASKNNKKTSAAELRITKGTHFFAATT
jgi:hypothetical protein